MWKLLNRTPRGVAIQGLSRNTIFGNPASQDSLFWSGYFEPHWVHRGTGRMSTGKYHLCLAYIFQPGVTAVYSGVFDQGAYHDPGYVGKRWRGVAGYAEQAYLSWTVGRWGFLLGRDFLIWGAGETGQLLFSDASRALDQVRVRYSGRHFTYTFLTSQLDPMRVPDTLRSKVGALQANRYLSALRIELKLRGRYYVAATHAILYGGPDAPYSWAFGLPVQFYHGSLVNYESSMLYGGGGNTFGTIDWDFYPGRKWELYGQILADDVQIEKTGPGDLEPNEVGLLTGFRKADPFGIQGTTLGLEYVAITNRTYKTAQFWEWWVHRNKPIGYPFGSDLRHISGFVRTWPNPHLSLTLRWNRIELGQGRMDVPWDTPWMTHTLEEGYDEPFPTGVVETTNRLTIELFWSKWPGLFVVLGGAWVWKDSADHVVGQRERHWELSLKFGWEWSVALPLD